MKARRIIVRAFLLLAALILIGAVFAVSSRQTISADRKATNGISYGYELQSYRFRHRIYLHIWNSAGMSLDYDLPGYYQIQIDETRWLGNDGAIYLRGAILQRDGLIDKHARLGLLYDFRTGEFLLSCALPLGRLDSDSSAAAWVTDEQMEIALREKSNLPTKP